LLDICQYYSRVQLFTEEEIEEESILDVYFKQIQVTWALIYGNLSKMSYDKCSKLMVNALNQDFRKMKEEDIQASAQRIYFCRFLKIDPVDAEKASKIQDLLLDMNRLLAEKSTTP
jgi:predicted transcriptional regulator